MKCCENCFSSKALQSIIRRLPKRKGNCSFCKSRSVPTFSPKKLSEQFQNLILSYAIAKKDEGGKRLSEQLRLDFPNEIFSSKMQNTQGFLNEISKGTPELDRRIYTHPVILAHKRGATNALKSRILNTTWEKFAIELKEKNRFHIENNLNLPELARLLERYTEFHAKGEIFYRARISTNQLLSKKEMLNPPRQLAKAGRANPQGISYLYVSNDLDTTLYETRATLFDFVSIGEFAATRELKVINLNSREYDPILLADEGSLDDYMMHAEFMEKLGRELSKPVRRADNELDYLPTQYLSEFIKSLGYDGIKYTSSLNPGGFNIAVFTPNVLKISKVFLHEVKEIKYVSEEIE